MPRTTPWPPGTPCWVDLGTSDMARTQQFYAGLFGWGFRDAGNGRPGYTVAHAGGHPAVGLTRVSDEEVDDPKTWIVYLATENLDDTAEAATRLGAQTLVPPTIVGSHGRRGVWADPSGAVFAAWEGAEHFGRTAHDVAGTPLWMDLMTHDIPAARQFYGRLFPLSFLGPDDGDYLMFTPEGADRPAGGIGAASPGRPDAWGVCFLVPSVERAAARAERLGGWVIQQPFDFTYGRLAVLEGPDGEVFSVIAPGGRPRQPAGDGAPQD